MCTKHTRQTDRPFLLPSAHSRDAGGVKPQSLSWPLGYSPFPSLMPPFPTPPPAAWVLNPVPHSFMAAPGLLGPSPCRHLRYSAHLQAVLQVRVGVWGGGGGRWQLKQELWPGQKEEAVGQRREPVEQGVAGGRSDLASVR